MQSSIFGVLVATVQVLFFSDELVQTLQKSYVHRPQIQDISLIYHRTLSV